MARRWTLAEEQKYREQLEELYVRQNKTISEIGDLIGIHEKSVYDRLLRLGIPTTPARKEHFCNQRNDVRIPEHSPDLAEFIGMMLGDGCLTHFQVMITLGNKEDAYVRYVQGHMSKLFGVKATILTSKHSGYNIVYIGSTKITLWLQDMGLVFNKVAMQVDAPAWIMNDIEYVSRFVRGFFDTDGSVYKLRFGIQISLTNHSIPLLLALQTMLKSLGYKPSAVSAYRVYVTRRNEVQRFFNEIAPQNLKHQRRFEKFMRQSDSGYSRRL